MDGQDSDFADEQPSRWGRFLAASLVLLVIGGVAWSWWLNRGVGPARRTVEPITGESEELTTRPTLERLKPTDFVDPRTTYQGPFRNVHPDVKYVGDHACAECHGEIEKSFRQHPMGHSADWVGDAPVIETFAPEAARFESQGYEVTLEQGEKSIRQRVRRLDSPVEAALSLDTNFIVGSGTQARSYLAVHKGQAWQATATWYTRDGKWDLSPGYEIPLHARRPVSVGCLDCHINRPLGVSGSLNRYAEGFIEGHATIGCERCHGPGQVHIDERSKSDPSETIDTSIVNPKHLSHELRSAICQQCHIAEFTSVNMPGRSKSEFRPGLELEHFVAMFFPQVGLLSESSSAQQFGDMRQAKCRHDDRPLDCVDCHDPHRKPSAAEAPAYFRDRCNACHQQKPCTESLEIRTEKEDRCAACHMPRSENDRAVHTLATDHRVMRRPTGRDQVVMLDASLDLIVPINPDSKVYSPSQKQRNFAAALARSPLSSSAYPLFMQERVTGDVLPRLLPALKREPKDEPGWQALAELHSRIGNGRLLLEAAQRAAALDPESETNLTLVYRGAEMLNRWDDALVAAERLRELNPQFVEHRLRLATTYLELRRWNEALAECETANQLNPLDAKARCLLAVAQFRLGDVSTAEKTLATALQVESREASRKQWQELYDRLTGKAVPTD